MNVCSITKGELMYVANEIHDQQSYPENKRIAVQSAGISFFFFLGCENEVTTESIKIF